MTGRTQCRIGIGLTTAISLFLLVDAALHILNVDAVMETMTELGYPHHLAPAIGFIELGCVALYAVRRTSPLGAVLLTGYLGGAIATNLRVEKPLFTTVLFPVYLGIAVWVGLYLCNADLRRLVRDVLRRDGTPHPVSATPAPVEAAA